MSGEDKDNFYVVYGYNAAQALVEVLKQCKDDLTRTNVMRQAEGLNQVHLDIASGRYAEHIAKRPLPDRMNAIAEVRWTELDAVRPSN